MESVIETRGLTKRYGDVRALEDVSVIVRRGEVAGTWTAKKKGAGLEVRADWWDNAVGEQQVRALAEQYAAFRGLELAGFERG